MSTTMWPEYWLSERGWPVSVVPEICGALCRWPIGTVLMPGSFAAT
jgi:3-oxoacyl-ACP reductase-like protein